MGAQLKSHRVTSVQREGWSGATNGELLKLISDAGHAAFITVDKNMPNQQAIHGLPFGIIVLTARSNKLAELTPLVPKILKALKALRPGEAVVVTTIRR